MPSQKNLSWYPGHMKKALDQIKKSLPVVDCIIELADARAPFSSLNSLLDTIVAGKMRLLVFSKLDLADQDMLARACQAYESKGYKVVKANLNDRNQVAFLKKTLENLRSPKEERYLRHGLNLPPKRCLIVGIPNVGKSTLINALVGKTKASVANTPGHTRAQQLIKVSDRLELIDTPGVLQPNYEDKEAVLHLSWLGSVKEDAIDMETVIVSLRDFLLEKYVNNVASHYNLKAEELNKDNFFTSIAVARGFLLKGGLPDEERARLTLLKEFRAGLLGKVVVDNV